MIQIRKNDPGEWQRTWLPEGMSNSGSATYPRDGRETIYDPYEVHAPTTTVGGYLAAVAAAMPHGTPPPARFPEDFAYYLLQRTPTLFGLEHYPPETPIDRFGRFGTPPDPKAAP
jgi:hypothetical protein